MTFRETAGQSRRKEILSRTWDTNQIIRTELHSVLATNDVLVFQEQKRFKTFAWGEELIEHVIDPSGARLTDSWDYYTNSAEGAFAQLKGKIESTGYWERYDYDDLYRQTNRVAGYLNGTNGS